MEKDVQVGVPSTHPQSWGAFQQVEGAVWGGGPVRKSHRDRRPDRVGLGVNMGSARRLILCQVWNGVED